LQIQHLIVSGGSDDEGTLRRPPAGPSMLLNQTFFNSPRIQEVLDKN
jgi:hypothetical protein